MLVFFVLANMSRMIVTQVYLATVIPQMSFPLLCAPADSRIDIQIL